jgi:Carboxypeptidase regulatory-like domain
MPQVTYQYVSFSGGPHQRQPTRSGSGGFTLIESSQGGTPLGGTFAAPPPPPTLTVGPNTFYFSFMTVSGGSLTAGGPVVGLTSLNSNVPPPPVYVGSTPINVIVVYVQLGGPPSPGATIDEFDETIGEPINDTFVTVTPDPGGYTTSANVDGFVPTTSSAEQIVAYPTTLPTGVDFVGWLNLGPPAVMNPSPTLPVAEGQSVWALAFYQMPTNLGSITGTVLEDSSDGVNPAIRASVVAQHGGVVTTNSDGVYLFTNLPPGPVTVTASARFASSESATVTVIAGETVTQDFNITSNRTKF